jgi:hypothetical protein
LVRIDFGFLDFGLHDCLFPQRLPNDHSLMNALVISPPSSDRHSPKRLTLRSTRTPPALPFALSQQLASSASFIVSVQARPVSFIR